MVETEVTQGDGSSVSANAAVAVNVGRGSSSTRVRSKQRIVQRSGETRTTTERDVATEREGRG